MMRDGFAQVLWNSTAPSPRHQRKKEKKGEEKKTDRDGKGAKFTFVPAGYIFLLTWATSLNTNPSNTRPLPPPPQWSQ